MAASSQDVTLLVLVVLITAASFSSTSAVDLASAKGSNSRKTLLESAEGMFTISYFSGALKAQQVNQPRVSLTPGSFSTKPLNTPAPQAVGPTPGLFNLKPRNSRIPPHGPAPGLFNLKPRNTRIPPHGPAPGVDKSTSLSGVSAAEQEREVNKGFNGEGATLIPAGF